jgi:hypothetical protein
MGFVWHLPYIVSMDWPCTTYAEIPFCSDLGINDNSAPNPKAPSPQSKTSLGSWWARIGVGLLTFDFYRNSKRLLRTKKAQQRCVGRRDRIPDAILAIYSALAKNVSAASWSNVLKVPHWQIRSSILQYPGSQYCE